MFVSTSVLALCILVLITLPPFPSFPRLRAFRDWLKTPVLCRVNAGYISPWGYGLAWRDYAKVQSIYAPMPLNVLLGQLRAMWSWFKGGWYGKGWEKDSQIHRLQKENERLQRGMREIATLFQEVDPAHEVKRIDY